MKRLSLFILFFVAAQFAISQVTYETATTSNGFGGVGAFTSSSKIMVDGDAKRTETVFKFTGSFLKHLSPKGTQIDITRLDKQLIWKFTDKEKKYTETTFAEMKEAFEKGMQDSEWPADDQGKEAKEEKTESDYEWQKPVIEVKKIASNVNVNNFNCNEFLATITTIGTHKQTGIKDTMLYKADICSNKKLQDDMKPVVEFDKQLMEALGFTMESNMAFSRLATMYKDQTQAMAKEISKIEGYPVKSDMIFTVTTHAYKSAQQENVNKDEKSENNDVAVTDVKGALGGFLGKKLAQKAAESAKPKDTTKKELFQATTELKSANTGSVDNGLFQVPAGYKLKK